jgi:hypothetical protein
LTEEEERDSRILISGIADMEDNPASSPMIQALTSKIRTVIKEMGINARIDVIAEGSEEIEEQETQTDIDIAEEGVK